MKLPKSKIEFELKEELTRKEDREYNEAMLKGATSTPDGAIDQSSIIGNIEAQKDILVRFFVKTFDGNEGVTEERLDELGKTDYGFLLEKCEKAHETEEEKKTFPKKK